MTASLHTFIYFVFIPFVIFGKSCNPEILNNPLVLVGSTPGDEKIKTLLGVPDTKVDFIRWQLFFDKPEENQRFELKIIFGESEPNTLGFKNGGENKTIQGNYRMDQHDKLNATRYRLKPDHLNQEISMVQINDNLFHLLTYDNYLMIGNGGWSYTLNREKSSDTSLSFIPLDKPSIFIGDTARQIIYEGRTPCQGFEADHHLNLSSNCFKLKWKLILDRDPETLLASRFTLKTTFNRDGDIIGSWTIQKGIPANPNAIIYKLNADKVGLTFTLWAGDVNVLFFLNEKNELYTGNSDFSFTMNRR